MINWNLPPHGAELANAIGVAGFIFYCLAYGLLQFGYCRAADWRYIALNILAPICVLVSLSQSYNLSSLLIQITWLAISLVGMLSLFRQRT